MRRCAALLALLAFASCKEKPKPISPAERGAAFFAPAADKLGELVAIETKKNLPAWYKEYLEKFGAKDEVELGRHIGKEVLKVCSIAMSVTESQEAAFKAGKFNDEDNKKKVRAAAARFADNKERVPDASRIAMMKVESGEWGSGLQLEFAARLLEGQFTAAKH